MGTLYNLLSAEFYNLMMCEFLQMAGHGGHREYKNSKQETDQTVLTIAKVLTTNCTKSGGARPKKIFAAPCAGSVPPNFNFVRAPLDVHTNQSANLNHSVRYVQTGPQIDWQRNGSSTNHQVTPQLLLPLGLPSQFAATLLLVQKRPGLISGPVRSPAEPEAAHNPGLWKTWG